ncbi:MAG: hypothetical protein U9P44_01115 [archaeon]|nr:hypothetical protein [archaeon]
MIINMSYIYPGNELDDGFELQMPATHPGLVPHRGDVVYISPIRTAETERYIVDNIASILSTNDDRTELRPDKPIEIAVYLKLKE